VAEWRPRETATKVTTRVAQAIVRLGLASRHLDGDVVVGRGVGGAHWTRFHGNNDIGAWTELGRLVEIGFGTTVGVSCCLMGPARIGNYCQLGPHVLVYGQDHPIDYFSTYTGKRLLDRSLARHRQDTPVEIGHGVWIGGNATILRGVRIGNGSVVGAGSVVTGDVAPYSIVVGNPARVVRARIDAELGELVDATRWWELRRDEQGALEPLTDVNLRTDPERGRRVLLEVLARLRS